VALLSILLRGLLGDGRVRASGREGDAVLDALLERSESLMDGFEGVNGDSSAKSVAGGAECEKPGSGNCCGVE